MKELLDTLKKSLDSVLQASSDIQTHKAVGDIRKIMGDIEEASLQSVRDMTVQRRITQAAIRSNAHWNDVSDELVWGEYTHDRPEGANISNDHMLTVLTRYPQYSEEIQSFVKHWNATPRITNEMLDAVKVDPEQVRRTDRWVASVLNYYLRLREVEKECSDAREERDDAVARLDYLKRFVRCEDGKFCFPDGDYIEGCGTALAATDPTFQTHVDTWMAACFTREIALDYVERTHRFIEEALELAQACGMTHLEGAQLLDYVYGRPAGEIPQEVGGAYLTLAALCSARHIDLQQLGIVELGRVWEKIDIIRAKQQAKPRFGPLPGPTLSNQAVAVTVDRCQED